jgi:hypothetical protein
LSSDLSVFVATPTTNGQFPLQTLISYLDTQEACHEYGIKVDFGFVSCSLVHHARSLLSHVFLENKTEFNRIFWIDSDIEFTPVDFMKVLHHTLKHDCAVGIYPRRCDPPAYYIRFPDNPKPPDDDGLVEIEATGMGFACIRRELMQCVADKARKIKFGMNLTEMPNVFRCDDDGRDARGEDYAFWDDVRDAGYKIYADATVTLGHVGTKVYRCRLQSPE